MASVPYLLGNPVPEVVVTAPLQVRVVPAERADGLECAYCGARDKVLRVICVNLDGQPTWGTDVFCSLRCWHRFNE